MGVAWAHPRPGLPGVDCHGTPRRQSEVESSWGAWSLLGHVVVKTRPQLDAAKHEGITATNGRRTPVMRASFVVQNDRDSISLHTRILASKGALHDEEDLLGSSKTWR
ncbi:ribosomal L32p family protein [Metarhizium robertsii ARSEF 23]|uniref:Ribosomal L32p family protein n=1 Tax=Metarhizium robertsii (strain ARSEF 23 / ATCC MYA-3075) TaxID=655844 RepID=A0A0B2XEW8_METRA|nr:ribosomal L32p family protein [Metarhizium robertsii ARSEF 23]KHO11290.1 ribosomal L32p family protein [Metarhizium robertsii ARSEF 23]